MKKKDQKLTIVGAGPGAADLITLRGLKAIQGAGVILYDALVDDSLLEFAPGIPKIFVGKRREFKAYTQTEINGLIVTCAAQYGHVVRLKGGDPFVFGRGIEELHFAALHGIDVEYAPGITSAVAAPGAAGISVTLRGVTRSFWTLTATTESGDLNPDIREAALADTTVVILMGLAKIREIVSVFESCGKSHTPVAVIKQATLPGQKSLTGLLSDIEEKLEAARFEGPAVIVIGEVVRASEFPLPLDQNSETLEFHPTYINATHAF